MLIHCDTGEALVLVRILRKGKKYYFILFVHVLCAENNVKCLSECQGKGTAEQSSEQATWLRAGEAPNEAVAGQGASRGFA